MNLKRRMKIFAGIVLVDMILMVCVCCRLTDCFRGYSLGASADGPLQEPKVAALTFDDGPNAKYTEKLLDGLKERGVKASFFLLGTCIRGNEEIVKRMDEEGHLIGVHSMQHTQLTKLPLDDAVEQLEETRNLIEEVTGKRVEYVRPPFGAWNQALEEAVHAELALEVVLWDVDSADWELQNRAAVVNNVVRNVENGDRILMHDEFGTSVDAALEIIDILTAEGYTFVTADELMVD